MVGAKAVSMAADTSTRANPIWKRTLAEYGLQRLTMPDRLPWRQRGLEASERSALARVLTDPTFELLPLKSVGSQIPLLPAGAHVSVTAAPGKGLEVTVDLAVDLQAGGLHAVPHLAARMVRDRTHLRSLLTRMADGGINRAFVVGGDASDPGAFPDGLSLLRAIADLGVRLDAIGVPCYPDGHVFIPNDVLLEALRAKLAFATYMTMQLCFDAARIGSWLEARRGEGIVTPAVIGIPGVTEPHRLLSISARIGVRDTRRFVARNIGLVGRLVRSGGFYRPDGLLAGIAPVLATPWLGAIGLHIYTFNQVGPTEDWRRRYVARFSS